MLIIQPFFIPAFVPFRGGTKHKDVKIFSLRQARHKPIDEEHLYFGLDLGTSGRKRGLLDKGR